MKQLINIKGYWSLLDNHTFKETDILEGSIIMNPDGWFEGLTTDLNSKSVSFVFGELSYNKKITLYKFTESKISPQFELVGECVVTGYDGKFEIIGVIQPLSCGVCHIDCKYPEVSEESDLFKQLEQDIEDYKTKHMDTICKTFYDSFISTHYKLEDQYNAKSNILEEYFSINNGNVERTKEAAMQLIREKPINTDGSMDDLPF